MKNDPDEVQRKHTTVANAELKLSPLGLSAFIIHKRSLSSLTFTFPCKSISYAGMEYFSQYVTVLYNDGQAKKQFQLPVVQELIGHQEKRATQVTMSGRVIQVNVTQRFTHTAPEA